MIEQTEDDRRVSPRVDYQGVVLVRNARQQIPCQALNLSETGILVRPNQRANPGAQFRVTFILPEASSWVDVEGRMVHRTWIGQRVSWGIQFVGIPNIVREELRHFVGTDGTPEPASRPDLPPAPAIPPVEVGVRAIEDEAIKDDEDEGPTRRVDASWLQELAAKDDTSQTPRDTIDRLLRTMKPNREKN